MTRVHPWSPGGINRDDVEVHAVDQKVLRGRPGCAARSRSGSLSRSPGRRTSSTVEGHQLDRVDLDLRRTDRVATRDFHLRRRQKLNETVILPKATPARRSEVNCTMSRSG
jgi:hypothetical protein